MVMPAAAGKNSVFPLWNTLDVTSIISAVFFLGRFSCCEPHSRTTQSGNLSSKFSTHHPLRYRYLPTADQLTLDC